MLEPDEVNKFDSLLIWENTFQPYIRLHIVGILAISVGSDSMQCNRQMNQALYSRRPRC